MLKDEKNSREGIDMAMKQAERARSIGDLDGAFELLESTKSVLIRLRSYDDLLRCFEMQENILRDRGDLDGILAVLKQHEHLCREMGKKDCLAICLVRQGVILKDRKSTGSGDPDFAFLDQSQTRDEVENAIALFKEAEQLFRGLGKAEGLAISLINQADLLVREMNKPEQALPLAEEANRLATKYGLGAADLATQVLDMCKEACEASQKLERLIRRQEDK